MLLEFCAKRLTTQERGKNCQCTRSTHQRKFFLGKSNFWTRGLKSDDRSSVFSENVELPRVAGELAHSNAIPRNRSTGGRAVRRAGVIIRISSELRWEALAVLMSWLLIMSM
jgi:hypothetical protein